MNARLLILTAILAVCFIVLPTISGHAQEPTTVLFVCEHGAAKSVIAAAEFNRLAKEQGLPYRAIARGVHPNKEVPEAVKKRLAADGLSVDPQKPTFVTGKEVRNAKRVVTLGCLLPPSKSARKVKAEDWKEIPSISENYEAARAAITQRVRVLLNELRNMDKRQ